MKSKSFFAAISALFSLIIIIGTVVMTVTTVIANEVTEQPQIDIIENTKPIVKINYRLDVSTISECFFNRKSTIIATTTTIPVITSAPALVTSAPPTSLPISDSSERITTTSAKSTSSDVIVTTTTWSSSPNISTENQITATMTPPITTFITSSVTTTATTKTTTTASRTSEKTTLERSKPIPSTPSNSILSELLMRINEYRKSNGLSAYIYEINCASAAEIRAKELASEYSHNRPNGKSYSTIYYELGISFNATSELNSYGKNCVLTASEAFDEWYYSYQHNEKLLSTSYKYIGLGLYTEIDENGNELYFWVCELADY